ncbi:glycosyltransferase family 2 protein [Tellurirhabdus bombi]|uniref:glycosyltransferase family 2 protein n=1 Tax=Tellurirhabdus bombi TaxID=2907205 RepID=UPI001F353B34|nr:glycosyltransferase family 2 protein [Tellurirhabdus bombi]
MDEVAIVILNYNGWSFLDEFLPLVLAYSEGHAVYVADNASLDNSVDLVQQHFPAVKIIRLERNHGYTGGYNEALAQIPATYYILLNSDVEVTPGWVSPLLHLMKRRPQAAACQPKLLAYHQKTHFEYAGAAGGYIDYLGYPFCRGRLFDTLEPDEGQYNDERQIFWATGACLIIRSELFWKIGGFDANFFAHMEEIDLCWRLKNRGYEIWYCPDSTVYHIGGGTLAKTNPRKTFLNYRNSLATLYKNLPSKSLFATIFARLVLDGASGLQLISKGQWRDTIAIIRAHFSFYSWLPELYKKRNKQSGEVSQIYRESVVWQYFVKGKKRFLELYNSQTVG